MTLDSLFRATEHLASAQSLRAQSIETPLGEMIALGDDQYIYLLEFLDKKGLQDQVIQFCQRNCFHISKGRNAPLEHLTSELAAYFKGDLQTFKTPLFLSGTDFQKASWKRLLEIPFGQTLSYAKQAENMGRPKSFRAVANANGCNRLSIVIPCHRVIRGDGTLGGYAGGLDRKSWLLSHEGKNIY